jgi:hypothetical protein
MAQARFTTTTTTDSMEIEAPGHDALTSLFFLIDQSRQRKLPAVAKERECEGPSALGATARTRVAMRMMRIAVAA